MTHLKIIKAIGSLIHEYENKKRKLYNCNFNQQCLQTENQVLLRYDFLKDTFLLYT
jgi:hypothetical protein